MWILSQRSHLVSLALGELSVSVDNYGVSQSHNYPAERGVSPNPLEPPLRTALIMGFPYSWREVDSQPFNQIQVAMLSAPHRTYQARRFDLVM